jgi:hypothetical protein
MPEYRSVLSIPKPPDASVSALAGLAIGAPYQRPVCLTCGESYVGVTEVACPFCGSADISQPALSVPDEITLVMGAD